MKAGEGAAPREPQRPEDFGRVIYVGGPFDGVIGAHIDGEQSIYWRLPGDARLADGVTYEYRPDLTHVSGLPVWVYVTKEAK